MKSERERIQVLFKHIIGSSPPVEYVDNWLAGDTSKDYMLQEWVLNQKPLLKGNPLSWCTGIGIIGGVVNIARYGGHE